MSGAGGGVIVFGGGVWRPIGLWYIGLPPLKAGGGGCCIWDTAGREAGGGGGAMLTELRGEEKAEEKAMETGAEGRVCGGHEG